MNELNSIRIKGVNYNVGADATVDQQYNPSSANAQSGTAVASAIGGKVDKTTTINGHALSSNVAVTKSDIGLENVVNTGDSATPISGGTTKFTTGGAYTELAKKADKTEVYTKTEGQALETSISTTLATQQTKIDALDSHEVIVGVLPSTGVAGKVYRVPDDPAVGQYTDYGYNTGALTTPIKIATYQMPGIDSTPTIGSENLVKSGGVAELFLTDVLVETNWESDKIMTSSDQVTAMYGWSLSDFFILDEGVTITGVFGLTNTGYSVCTFFDEGAERAFQRFTGTGEEQTFTVPRRCYVRLSVNDTANPTHSIILLNGGMIDLKKLSDDVNYIKEHSDAKKSIWEGKKVGFLGDSTSTSGTSTYVSNYVELTGCLAQNYAVGGTSVADNGQPNPICTRFSALPNDLDMVLILGGVNDFRLGIPLGNFEDFNTDGSLNGTFYGALHTLIRGLKTKYLDKPIVYMTPMHNNYKDDTYGDTGEYNYNQLQLGRLVENKFPLNNGNVDDSVATGGTLSEYILAIKKVCGFYGVRVIDLHDICGI